MVTQTLALGEADCDLRGRTERPSSCVRQEMYNTAQRGAVQQLQTSLSLSLVGYNEA